jgi:hypothetical protein
MTEEINFVKTTTGSIPVVSKTVGDYLIVLPVNRVWGITHKNSGMGIAYFENEKTARAIAQILDVTCDWNWQSPDEMPDSTKKMVHKLFSALCKVVQFKKQND